MTLSSVIGKQIVRVNLTVVTDENEDRTLTNVDSIVLDDGKELFFSVDATDQRYVVTWRVVS